MEFYILLWLIFYGLGMVSLVTNKRISFGLVASLMTIVAYCVAFRVDVGADWGGYVEFYNTNVPADGRDITEIEPLFRLLRNLFYALGLSYQSFFFVISLFSLFTLVWVSNSFGVNNVIVLIVYISLSFCAFQLNIIRIGIMCSCLWIGLSYRKDNLTKSILWIIIGCGFHYLGLIFIPILIIVDKIVQLKWFYIIIALSFISLLLNIGIVFVESIPFLATLGHVSDYLDPDSSFRQGHGITIGLLFNIFFCLYLRYRYRKKYLEDINVRILFNIILVGIVFVCWLNGLGIIAQRGGQSMFIALCFVWSLFLTNLRVKERTIWIILFTAYLLLFYMRNFTSQGSEDRMLVPFKMEFASFFQ